MDDLTLEGLFDADDWEETEDVGLGARARRRTPPHGEHRG